MDLAQKIRQDEGFESEIYEDSLGFKTIGYGFLLSSLSPEEIALNGDKISPMSREIADKILNLKLEKLKNEVFKTFFWLKDKTENVQNVIMQMCYQMGVNRVKKFASMLHHIRSDEYEKAVRCGLKSLWAKQTPNRAKKVLSELV